MKNSLILIFIMMIIPVANAQRVFHFGMEGGINGSQISGDTYGGYNQPGGYAGIYTRIHIKERYAFQLGIAFSQKGARKIQRPEKGDYSFYDLRLNYIEVPIIFRVNLRKIIGETGLFGAYLTSSSEENLQGPVVPFRPFHKAEFGGYLGAGYKWGENLEFTVRASNSLIPVREHMSGTAFRWNRGQYSAVLTFMLRFTFPSKESRVVG
jgi:hypothetical protein